MRHFVADVPANRMLSRTFSKVPNSGCDLGISPHIKSTCRSSPHITSGFSFNQDLYKYDSACWLDLWEIMVTRKCHRQICLLGRKNMKWVSLRWKGNFFFFQSGVCIQFPDKSMKNECCNRETASISGSIGECHPVKENTNKKALSELPTAHAYLSWWETRVAQRIDVRGQDQIAF